MQVASDLIEEETNSTSPTTIPAHEEDQIPPKKYHLFEKLMEFLDTEGELNPVLSGYFSKLMLMLISNKTR